MARRFLLVGGGARSGKSRYALAWAEARGRVGFVATAEAYDEEMRARIDQHRAERGEAIATREAPLDPVAAIEAFGAEVDVILLDCLTLFLSNLLCADRSDAEVEAEVARLADAIAASPADIVVVTNEVGLGIVPMDALSRRFRDLTGRAHQRLAAQADEVVAGMLGTLLELKPGPVRVVGMGPG